MQTALISLVLSLVGALPRIDNGAEWEQDQEQDQDQDKAI